MYHVLAEPTPSAPYPDLYVSPNVFRAQLEWLDGNGFTAVTLSDVWRSWHGQGRPPAKPIVISIDDGFRNTHSVGLPALRAHGWPAVLNLTLSHLGPSWGLSEGRVRGLLRAGWELGSHTFTHPDLTQLDDARLRREVAGSKRALERRFDVRISFFCYPAGRFDARVVAAVRRAGFRGATTTIEGRAVREEPFTLRRIRVSRGDGVSALAEKLGQSR
jgi:peptidoglycan/xylan/chitin deacetylase (PgdA/CDA1 family)